MIYGLPKNWRDLQNKTCKMLLECGFDAEVEKEVKLVRGKTKIDVFANDKAQKPEIIYFCECKYWDSNIPQDEVQAFKSKINDYGANIGFVISKVGFQKGAYEVAEKTNVNLVTWDQFQSVFEKKWFESRLKKLYDDSYPLRDYTKWFGRINEIADNKLDSSKNKFFSSLQRKYEPLAMSILNIIFLRADDFLEYCPKEFEIVKEDGNIKKVKVDYYSDLFDLLFKECYNATEKFDKLFGERIRIHVGDDKPDKELFDRITGQL